MKNKHLLNYTNIKKYWLGYFYMEECFRCGATREETRLFDAIADEGVVKSCRDCIFREGLPTVKKPSLNQLKESDERLSVREKLSMMAGIETRRDSRGNREYIRTSSEKGKSDYDLNDIIERNLEKRKLSKKSLEKLPPEKELVENFHWKVMRGRRLKKISQEQLGAEIGESETAVNMVENGELPEDFERLIKKLEAYLRIRLFKNPERSKGGKKSEAEISFEPYSNKKTTVGDLKGKSSSQYSEGQGEKQYQDTEKAGTEEEEIEKEFPEENKTKRKKLWNLFRKKAKKAEREDFDDSGEKEIEESDENGLYYDDLEDYTYQEYEEPQEKKQTNQNYSKGEKERNKGEKENNKDKEDKNELSRKDIDDLIFRKS